MKFEVFFALRKASRRHSDLRKKWRTHLWITLWTGLCGACSTQRARRCARYSYACARSCAAFCDVLPYGRAVFGWL